MVVLLCIQCTDPKLSTPEPLPQTETCKNSFEPHKALSTPSGYQGHGGETAEEVEEELGLPQLLSKTDLYENIAEKIVHKEIGRAHV